MLFEEPAHILSSAGISDVTGLLGASHPGLETILSTADIMGLRFEGNDGLSFSHAVNPNDVMEIVYGEREEMCWPTMPEKGEDNENVYDTAEHNNNTAADPDDYTAMEIKCKRNTTDEPTEKASDYATVEQSNYAKLHGANHYSRLNSTFYYTTTEESLTKDRVFGNCSPSSCNTLSNLISEGETYSSVQTPNEYTSFCPSRTRKETVSNEDRTQALVPPGSETNHYVIDPTVKRSPNEAINTSTNPLYDMHYDLFQTHVSETDSHYSDVSALDKDIIYSDIAPTTVTSSKSEEAAALGSASIVVKDIGSHDGLTPAKLAGHKSKEQSRYEMHLTFLQKHDVDAVTTTPVIGHSANEVKRLRNDLSSRGDHGGSELTMADSSSENTKEGRRFRQDMSMQEDNGFGDEFAMESSDNVKKERQPQKNVSTDDENDLDDEFITASLSCDDLKEARRLRLELSADEGNDTGDEFSMANLTYETTKEAKRLRGGPSAGNDYYNEYASIDCDVMKAAKGVGQMMSLAENDFYDEFKTATLTYETIEEAKRVLSWVQPCPQEWMTYASLPWLLRTWLLLKISIVCPGLLRAELVSRQPSFISAVTFCTFTNLFLINVQLFAFFLALLFLTSAMFSRFS